MKRVTANDVAIEALAESWASIDGKLDRFRACKENGGLDDVEGHYKGYLCDAEEMIRRLETRGFTVVPLPESKQASG